MKALRVIMTICMLLGVQQFAWAMTPTAELTSPKVFVDEYIRELIELDRIAVDAKNDVSKKANNESFTSFIYYSRKQQNVLNANIYVLKSMRLQTTENNLQTLPAQMANIYETKNNLISKMISITSDGIISTKSEKELAEEVSQLPKLRADNDMIEETIGKQITVLVFYSLVDPKGDDKGGTSKLLITKRERMDLIEKLQRAFGNRLNEKTASTWWLFAAQILYDGLSGHMGNDEIVNPK